MERKIDRFDKYMSFKGLNDNRVTVELGLSIGTLGKSRKPSRDLSEKNIELILNSYEDLNRFWLLTGEGEMIKDEQKIYDPNSEKYWLKSNIDKLIDDNSRNSKSIEKMVETADRNSQILEKLVDILYNSGIGIYDIKRGVS